MSDIQEYPDVVQEVRGALVSSYLGILCFLLLPSAQTSITACEVTKSKTVRVRIKIITLVTKSYTFRYEEAEQPAA